MNFPELTAAIPKNVDVRPLVGDGVKRYISFHPELGNKALSSEGDILTTAWDKAPYEKKSTNRSEAGKPLSIGDTTSDYYKNIVDGWMKADVGKRGDPLAAQAVFYWFFRYVEEPSYFIQIAKKTWNVNSATYKRFYYAKKGGPADDDFDTIAKRFCANNALEEYAKICVEDEILEPHLTVETLENELHYSKRLIKKVLGREDEQKKLFNFLKGGRGFRWLQLAGTGGQGKSRLAFELVCGCTSRWYAGFLSEIDLNSFKSHWNDWLPTKPTLIVIDYILGQELEVKEALQTLAKRSNEFTVPVRLLLVERQRWDQGSLIKKPKQRASEKLGLEIISAAGNAAWFLKLCDNTHDGSDAILSNSKFENGVIELTKLNDDDLVTITRQIAKHEGAPTTLDDDAIKKHLHRIDHTGRPLFAYLFGRALGSGEFRTDWDQGDLLARTIARDQNKRWCKQFGGDVPLVGEDTPSMRLAALATMIEGLEIKSVNWPEDWPKFNQNHRHEALVLVDGHIGNDPRVISVIPELQPDILGEWFVLSCLSEEMNLEAMAQLAWDVSPNKMAAFLQRCAQEFPERKEVFQLLNIAPKQKEGRTAYTNVSAAIFASLFADEKFDYPPYTIEAIIRAADKNNTKEMIIVGHLALTGIGMVKNPEVGIEWFRKAAETGNSDAMCDLGLCYQQGTGVDADPVKAVKWFRKAAETGNSRAMYNLGVCYQQDFGVDVDTMEAVKWYRKAAEIGNSRAMYNLGFCYQQGTGVDADPVKAVKWYRRAAEAGNSDAMFILGICYKMGIGVDADTMEAMRWFRNAAETGNSDAMYNLGVCYQNGTGVDADTMKAVKWFRKAAEIGNSRAMCNLGVCYELGTGVDADPVKAVRWYRKAAEAGNNIAMFNFGLCYEVGIGVKADTMEAVKWYHKAVEAGDNRAKDRTISYPDRPGLVQDDIALAGFSGRLRDEVWPIEPIIEGDWAEVPETESHAAIRTLSRFSLLAPGDKLVPIALRTCPLSFYPKLQLLEVLFEDADELRVACFLAGEDGTALILAGNPSTIRHVNALGYLRLEDAQSAEAYLRFFGMAVCSKYGPFRIIDYLDLRLFSEQPSVELLKDLSPQVSPLKLSEETPDAYFFSATLKCGDTLFQTRFRVPRGASAGTVDLVENTKIMENLVFYQEGFEGVFRFRRAPEMDQL